MSGLDFPTIKVELQSMRHSLTHAMNAHCGELAALAKQAIEKELQPERLQAIANKEAATMLETAMKDAVSKWFYHTGRKIIFDKVQEQLDERKNMFD